MIKRFLRWIWCPGPCKWKIIQKGPITFEGKRCGTYYDLQCETCGIVRNKECMS